MRLPAVFPHLRALRINDIVASSAQITIIATCRRQTARCPLCGRRSQSVHSHYERVLHDLPWSGIPVELHLRLRRFRCRNAGCQRKVFVERLPELVGTRSRRTEPLRSALLKIAYVLGGLPGSRLACVLGMPASRSTLLRLLRSRPDPPPVPPRILGIDDWAFARGRRYGTILVDLEERSPIDLLPDRTVSAVVPWLQSNPSIEVVSRDRGGAYAEAATSALPDTVQVADRWHLLKNLGDALDTLLQRHHRLLREVASDHLSGPVAALPPLGAVPPPEPDRTALREMAERRSKRLDRYEQVMSLFEQDTGKREIARRVGISRRTVHRYLQAGSFPEIKSHGPFPSILDPYEGYLLDRWNAGCRNGAQLYREIRERGYPGGRSQVKRLVTRLRQAQGLCPGQRVASTSRPIVSTDLDLRSPRQARWLFLRRPEHLTDGQRDAVERLRQHEELDMIYRLVQRFTTILRERLDDQLAQWVEDIVSSGIRELVSFAEGLRRDWQAVEAGVRLPWSQGQTEGQVNRLKLIKRQMYGRANFDLLRIRVLHHT